MTEFELYSDYKVILPGKKQADMKFLNKTRGQVILALSKMGIVNYKMEKL